MVVICYARPKVCLFLVCVWSYNCCCRLISACGAWISVHWIIHLSRFIALCFDHQSWAVERLILIVYPETMSLNVGRMKRRDSTEMMDIWGCRFLTITYLEYSHLKCLIRSLSWCCTATLLYSTHNSIPCHVIRTHFSPLLSSTTPHPQMLPYHIILCCDRFLR
jgi:hypothetical protein